MAHYCGVDFGTSNSVIALCSDEDPAPRVSPSCERDRARYRLLTESGRAKIELSTAEVGRVVCEKDKLRIREEITRDQFNGYVAEGFALSARLRGVTAG